MFKRAIARWKQTSTKITFWGSKIDKAETIPELQTAWGDMFSNYNLPTRAHVTLMGKFIDRSLSIAKKQETDVGKQYQIAEKSISVLPMRPLAKAMLLTRTTSRLTE